MLTPIRRGRFQRLLGVAFLARHIRGPEAFLLAADQNADYDSPNFLWFRERLTRFVYIDRIVVSPITCERGLARRLYMDLFEHALRAGYGAALGFEEVGLGVIDGGAKTVRYLSRLVDDRHSSLSPRDSGA